MLAGVAKLWSRRGIAAMTSLSMLLPEGDETLTPHLAFIDDVLDAPWPQDPLLLCAVRRRDSRRTVFGPGAKHAPLAAAITASCAVPGYFADVVIDGETYVDGGVISATNADVLARHDIDLAIVISPMTGASGGPSFGRADPPILPPNARPRDPSACPQRHSDGRHRTRPRSAAARLAELHERDGVDRDRSPGVPGYGEADPRESVTSHAQHAHPSMRDVGVPIRFDLEMLGTACPSPQPATAFIEPRDANRSGGNVVTIGRR